MPELPDIEAYCVALDNAVGQGAGSATLLWLDIRHPFLLRSVTPPPEEATGARVAGISRLGKRIVIALDNQIHLVIHLMIAGRLKWKAGTPSDEPDRPGRPGRGSKSGVLALLAFSTGVLTLTEAGSRRRASLHVVRGTEGLAALDPGGLELLREDTALLDFSRRLCQENHTVKRALTDPRLFSGIGNSYSDEILFAARMSPFAMTGSLDEEQVSGLYRAAVGTLRQWRDRLVGEARERFPGKVTAFRPEMNVHGRFGQECTVCGTPIQRVRYAENECDYCPTCQAGGKVYADRALSRLLKSDWPRTVEELEKLGRPPGSA